jgi:hypothetical protein
MKRNKHNEAAHLVEEIEGAWIKIRCYRYTGRRFEPVRANHGTGLIVEYTTETGSVPKMHVGNTPDLQRGKEYREAVEAVHAAMESRYGRCNVDDFLHRRYISDRWIWDGIREALSGLRKAKDCRVHSIRQRKLAELAQYIKGGRA